MVTPENGRKRARGSIDTLPSGALRVRVNAGEDPLTGKRHYLSEVIAPGPRAAAEAEKTRTRFLAEVDQQRNPTTRATLNQLLDRYLEVLDVEPSTRKRYESIIRLHIRPALGRLPLSKLDGELLDRFYAQLRTCRERCAGGGHTRHRTPRPHECDDRCRPKGCKPLSASSIRAAHWILSAALTRAVRWRWINRNPIETTQPPAPVRSNPSPPTPDEAAALIMAAGDDEDWAAFVWAAMTTGARRGELCALRRGDVDLAGAVLRIESALKLENGDLVRRETKTHQQRRIALDPETVAVLTEHLARVDERAAAHGISVVPGAYLFTSLPDGSAPIAPDTATQRYARMAARLGIASTFHKLRHYSATELIAAGVDIRTVAGRLGHGGGGATTLKVYAAWISEADQRAATSLAGRMPKRASAPKGAP
jgi:integrase